MGTHWRQAGKKKEGGREGEWGGGKELVGTRKPIAMDAKVCY